MRRRIIAGNWKMNKTLNEGTDLVKSINNYFSNKADESVEVIICTPFIHLVDASKCIDVGNISIGAQNCSDKESGAFTGEISASMIRSTGADYVIIGHSERRSYFNESDHLLYNKTLAALKNNLKPVFCCGEILEEREKNNHFNIVKTQLLEGVFKLSKSDFKNIIIAYEPVWAIGTGVTASSEQAQEMHSYIRSLISEQYDNETADIAIILYGGSCNPKNAAELFSMADVDGGLIGGASLNKDDFCTLAESFPK